jgi:hypothetical protein
VVIIEQRLNSGNKPQHHISHGIAPKDCPYCSFC